MKKILLLTALTLSTIFSALSDNVPIRGYQSKNAGSTSVGDFKDRKPMHVPITVDYDSTSHIINITCPDDLVGEVYIYNEYGDLESYSPMINVTLTVSPSDHHFLYIEGDGWCAEAEF